MKALTIWLSWIIFNLGIFNIRKRIDKRNAAGLPDNWLVILGFVAMLISIVWFLILVNAGTDPNDAFPTGCDATGTCA